MLSHRGLFLVHIPTLPPRRYLDDIDSLSRYSDHVEILIQIVPVLVLVRNLSSRLNIRLGRDAKLFRRLLGDSVGLAKVGHGGLIAVNLLLLRDALHKVEPKVVAFFNEAAHGGGVLELVADDGVEAAAFDDLVVLSWDMSVSLAWYWG